MLFLIPTIFLFCYAFYGIGFLAHRMLNLKLRPSFALMIFLGICFSSLYFSIIQFFSPLNIITLICLLLAGFIGIALFVSKNSFTALFNLLKQNINFILLDIILVIIISMYICSYSVVDKIFAYDTVLYHSTLVSWLNFSKIVPGLANLHGRLGINSSYLILAAGIDVGIFDKYSSSILPAIFLFSTFRYFFELIANDKLSKNYKLFSIVLTAGFIIAPTAGFIRTNAITPNLYYDLPSLVFICIVICELLIQYQEKLVENKSSLSVIFIFAAMSFTIKQIGAITVLIVFCLGLYDIIKSKKKLNDFIAFIIIPILFGITYLIRNIIQTGYPLYPILLLGLNFKWATSDHAQELLYEIQYSARLPNVDYTTIKDNGFLFWFLPWLKTNIYNNQIYFTTIILSLFFTIKNIFITKIRGKQLANFITLMGIIISNIIFWFITAPSFRFGSLFFFLLLALTCYFANAEKSTYIFLSVLVLNIVQTSNLIINSSILHDRGYILNYLWCIITCYILYLLIFKTSKQKQAIACLLLFFILYHPHNGHLERQYPAKIGVQPCHPVELNNGQNPPLTVYVPDIGDQTGDAQLPCTPYPNDKLKLIEPGNIRKGFYIED